MQDATTFRLDAVPAEGLEAVLHLAVGLQGVGVRVLVLVGSSGTRRSNICGQPGELAFQVGDVGGATHDLVDDGTVDLLGELLGQVADPAALGDVHLAGVRPLLPDLHVPVRGCADAVAADVCVARSMRYSDEERWTHSDVPSNASRPGSVMPVIDEPGT